MKKTILFLTSFVVGLNAIGQGPTSSYYFNNSSTADSTSNANGIVYGAIPTADRFGNDYKAYLFNGTSDYILIPDHASNDLNNMNGISISAWFRQDAVSGGLESIVTKWNNSTSEQYGLFKNGSSTFVAVRSVNNNGASDGQSTGSGWHHAVFTFDKATNIHNIYIDGVNTLVDYTPAGTYSNSSDVTSLSIGAQATDLNGGTPAPTRFFNGAIDDVLIYDRVLSSTEVDSLYNVDSPQCEGMNIEIKSTTISSGSNGSFTFNLTGGLAPYTYSIDNGGSVAMTSNILCDMVGEGSTSTLTTPGINQYITNVNFVSYGNPSNSCGGFQYNDCNASSSMSIARDSLIGRSTGSIVCGNQTFGDPCFGTGKNFRIQVSYAEDTQLNNLAPGNHDLVITDSYGCSETVVVNIPSGVVGVQNNEITKMNIYPNPVSDVLNIFSNYSGNIDICTILGNKVKTLKINAGKISIDVSDLTPNVYLIVNPENGIYQKFVIQ
jgi:hypothetical protein